MESTRSNIVESGTKNQGKNKRFLPEVYRQKRLWDGVADPYQWAFACFESKTSNSRIIAATNDFTLHLRDCPYKYIKANSLAENNLYYSSRESSKYILPMFDVDVGKIKGKGTPEGAKAAIALLKKRYPGLYSETSRSGKGQNAWPLVDRTGYTAKQVNKILKQWQRLLEQELIGCDIEKFEIKGTCAYKVYQGRVCVEAHSGQLGRWPRKTDSIGDCVLKLRDIEQEVKEQPAQQVVQIRTEGSTSFARFWCEEDKGSYYSFVNTCSKPGRRQISLNDWTCARSILNVVHSKPNADGSLPYARVEALWNHFYEIGLAEHRFEPHKWKVIKEWLIQHRLLEVDDNRYWYDGFGTGQAMKMHVTASGLDLIKNTHTILTGTVLTDEEMAAVKPLLIFKLSGYEGYNEYIDESLVDRIVGQAG